MSIPSESTQRYTLEVCPWNAIDMLHNPNVARDEQGVLQPYYLGQQRELPWGKLEEYGYQLALNGQVRVAAAAEEVLAALKSFEEPDWGVQEDRRKIVERPVPQGDTVLIAATAEGGELLRFLFRDYPRIFLD